MKRFEFKAIFALLVAAFFLMPTTAALGSTSGDDDFVLPGAETYEPGQGNQDDEGTSAEEDEDNSIPDSVDIPSDTSLLVPWGKNIVQQDKPVTSKAPDTTMKTKSSVMIISKIGLHDDDNNSVDELDDGELGRVSAEITNEGGEDDVMTDVEVDFYYIDKDGDLYYIDTENIALIEGNGSSEFVMVDWKADSLAVQIKVVADRDGSDGGPSEEYEDITVTQADYAQKLYCPYPSGSGTKGETLEYMIKVDNIGKYEDKVKLEISGQGTWTVEFENGQSSKTIHGLKADDHQWEPVYVTIPMTAGGNDGEEITITATSQSDTEKSRTIDISTTVSRSTRPILLLDRDRGSAQYGTWCDTTKYWAAALDDGGYGGMYLRTSGAIPADTSSYDVIMMPTGYDWMTGLTTADEKALISFLQGGGALWIGGSLFFQASDETSYGKTTVHPLFYRYMNASWQAQSRHPPSPLIGVANDPIGQNSFYGMNYIYTVGQDWAESVWPYSNDTWTDGTFYHGDVFVGIRHHWQGTTDPDKPEEYRTVYTGFDLAQVGDTFVQNDDGSYGHPDRTDVMYNTATWLGISPPLPKEEDLAVNAIIDPAGDYIYPNDNLTINLEITNLGIMDYEIDFTVTVNISQQNGDYLGENDTDIQKTVDGSMNPVPARGYAYPGASIVSLVWTVPDIEGAEWKFTATLEDDDNNDNNELVKYATADKIQDVRPLGCEWEWRVHYWLTASKNTPIGFDLEVENAGSRTATFVAYVRILDPWENDYLENLEKEVTLGAGHSTVVHFVWTPDKAAGVRDATQSWRVSYTEDGPPYWIDVGVDSDDDNMGNNEITHDKADSGNQVGDITVVDWYESGEMGEHGWDWEEPWHITPMFTLGGEYGVWHGNKTSVDLGAPRYDNDQAAIMTSPLFDWTQYTDVASDYLYTSRLNTNGASSGPDYVSIQIKTEDDEDDTDYWKDAPSQYSGNTRYGSNRSADNGNGGYLNNGNPYQDYAGHLTRLRWTFYSDDDVFHRGFSYDLFIIMATADNYFDKDLIIDSISVNPLVGDVEDPRTIKVSVKNIGEVVPDSTFRVYLNLTNSKGEDQTSSLDPSDNYQEVDYDKDFTKGTVTTIDWGWIPGDLGIYNIECYVQWDDDEFPDNNGMESVGLVQYYFFFDDMENGNPPLIPGSSDEYYDPWESGTEDSNNKGGNRATDDWELGEPTVGPKTAFSGTKCWATSLDDYYSNNSKDSSYLMRNINLRAAKDPYLLFVHWLEIEAEGYDSAYVEIQVDGSDKWSVLWQNPEPLNEHFRTKAWQVVNISLAKWQLKNINLRFRLMSDADVSYSGWYIDDVGVSGNTPPDYDASLDSIEVTPFYGGYIPPSESIVIDATVSNIGTKDSGGSHPIKVTADVYKVTSPTTKNLIEELDEQTVQINSGDSAIVSFNYNLPGGNNYKYEIVIDVEYIGEKGEHMVDNDGSIILWGKKLHDAAIDRLYVTPPLEDAGFPRVVTAVVTSHSNVPEGIDSDFSIKFEVFYEDHTEAIASGSVPVYIEVGETKEVIWNFTAYTYGEYDVIATVELAEDNNNDPGHENVRSVVVKTVEKVFSDTVDNPVINGRKIIEQDVFWTGLEEDEKVPGWHMVDRGYLSRESYYVGRPSEWTYEGPRRHALISEPINLENVTGATMRWYTKFHVEGGAYDNLLVYFTTEENPSDDDDWQQMAKYPQFNQRNSSHYSESDDGWLQMEIPLSGTYYDQNFRIKFLFISDRAIEFFGVLVDDISIYVSSSTDNHQPRALFTAEWLNNKGETQATAYGKHLIDLPLPAFEEIRRNYAYQNLPTPEGGKQGGIGYNADSKSSDTIQFDASYSFDPDFGDADDLSYSWDFGDGVPGSGVSPTHSYAEIPPEKFYEVTLTVTDDEGPYDDDETENPVWKDTLFVWIGNSPPDVKFTITDSFDTNHVLDKDGVAEVFYEDTLMLVSDVTDPENDQIISYKWEFYEENNYDEKTEAVIEVVEFTVGVHHLYQDEEGGVGVMPPYNSNPVTYIIKLTAMDSNRNEADYSLKVIVSPFAMHEFVSQVKVGATLMDASVNLIWRGDVNDAAPSSDLISSKPVYVYIKPVESPDPNLATKGGIGLVYDITSVGCKLQNGLDGFKSAEIRLPILNADIEAIGDSYSLSDDIRLEYYDKIEKRFFAVSKSHVMSDDGVKYVVGEVEHFSIYTAIVDSIYNQSNVKYGEVLPDLLVQLITFSRSPAQNGQDVEVRVTIQNLGKISARNVEVKIYDGDDLVGDQRIDLVGASGEKVIVSETFIVVMLDPNTISGKEIHTIKVFVNKQQAISEGSGNYRNNVGSELLEVTTVQTTTPSFESTAMMMVVSSMMVVGSSMVALKKLGRKKEED